MTSSYLFSAFFRYEYEPLETALLLARRASETPVCIFFSLAVQTFNRLEPPDEQRISLLKNHKVLSYCDKRILSSTECAAFLPQPPGNVAIETSCMITVGKSKASTS